MSKPTVVCLCGSTRFFDVWQRIAFEESLAGRITLGVAFFPGVKEHGPTVGITPEQKAALDELHLRRIDLADEVFVLNVDGYIGESTRRELAYAIVTRKDVRFLEPEAGDRFLRDQSNALGALGAEVVAAGPVTAPPEATGPYPCRWCLDPRFTNECPLRPAPASA